MSRSTHFTARLVVDRVDKEDGNTGAGRSPVSPDRIVTEIASINIKATDFDKLKEKLAGHIDWLDPDDIVDQRSVPEKPKVMR
jgi:hypothetical protein